MKHRWSNLACIASLCPVIGAINHSTHGRSGMLQAPAYHIFNVPPQVHTHFQAVFHASWQPDIGEIANSLIVSFGF